VILLHPSPRVIHDAEGMEHEGLEDGTVVDINRFSGTRPFERSCRPALGKVRSIHPFDAVIGYPAAPFVKEAVPLLQRFKEIAQAGNIGIADAGKSIYPLIERARSIDSQRVIGAPCGIQSRARAGMPSMILEGINRVIGSAHNGDLHLAQQCLCAEFICSEHLIALIVYTPCGSGVEEFVNAEEALQLEMRPVIERIPERVGNCGCPGVKSLPIRNGAGNEFLIDPVGAHGSPLIVIAGEPELGDARKPVILGNLPGREVTVIVEYREIAGVLDIEFPCRRRLKKKIIRYKWLHRFSHFLLFLKMEPVGRSG
jgi:hypothetical protein